MTGIHVPDRYRKGEVKIYRTYPEQRGPLHLGKVSIEHLRNWITEVDGGTGLTVGSPLWAGWAHKKEERGNNDLERVIRDFTRVFYPELISGKNKGDFPIRWLQYGAEHLKPSEYTDREDLTRLIIAQAITPLMSAIADREAIAQGKTIADYLDTQFGGDFLLPYNPERQVVPAITVGGDWSVDKAEKAMSQFGERGLLKYKVGKIQDWEADLERIVKVQEKAAPGTKFIIDANQAYGPEEYINIIEGLKTAEIVDDLLFFEQPFKIGEETEAMRKIAPYVRAGQKISFDESVSSSDDVYRIKEALEGVLDSKYHSNIVVVPKIEKGGLVEFMEIVAAAEECGFMVSPSTLTGPPLQYALFADLTARMKNVITLEDGSIPVEANGFEFYVWSKVAEAYTTNPRHPIFKIKPSMPEHNQSYAGIPPLARPKEGYTNHQMTSPKNAIIRV